MTDEQYLEAFKIAFPTLPSLFSGDVIISLTDTEKYLQVIPAKTFQLIIKEGSRFPWDEANLSPPERALRTLQKQTDRFPKEYLGFPVVGIAVPLVNPDTGNAVGTISYAFSQEREQTVQLISEEVQTFAGQLNHSTGQLAQASQELAENSQEIAHSMGHIQQKIKDVDAIIQFIHSIADTTNLLGLNAAIEAARAGDQGRGFGVVAAEIRKLAANSKNSVNSITGTLMEMKKKIEEIMEYVSGFAALSEQQAAQTEEISAGSEKLNEVSNQLVELAEKLY